MLKNSNSGDFCPLGFFFFLVFLFVCLFVWVFGGWGCYTSTSIHPLLLDVEVKNQNLENTFQRKLSRCTNTLLFKNIFPIYKQIESNKIESNKISNE